MFSNIVYLNMDHDIDRRAISESQFLEHGLNVARFSAIEKNLQEYVHNDISKLRLSAPQLSCLVSHLELLREYGGQDLLVFEDDIDLSPVHKWGFSFSDIIENLPKEVGILQMYTFPTQPMPGIRKWFPGMFGTTAYFVRSWYVEALISKAYHDGKWDVLKLESGYVQPVADSVLYTSPNSYSLTVFGVRDVVSNIFPNATYNKTGAEVTRDLIFNPPSIEAIKRSFEKIK